MNELKLKPCRQCKTTEKLRVITFLGKMCKIKCSKCGTATAWLESMEEAEYAWNSRVGLED